MNSAVYESAKKGIKITKFVYVSMVFFLQHVYCADIDVLKVDQAQKLQVALSQIEQSSLDEVYTWQSLKLLDIHTNQLFDGNQQPVDLKCFFEQHSIKTGYFLGKSSGAWTEEEWRSVFSILEKRAMGKAPIREEWLEKVNVFRLPTLMRDARIILESCMAYDSNQLSEEKFIKKTGLFRFFTYVKLQQVILEEKLSHVHLPLKICVIKNETTNLHVHSQEAAHILDNAVHFFSRKRSVVNVEIDFLEPYQMCIFAEKKKNHKISFTAEVMKQLVRLIQKAPFDIGYDNIFSDANGDAVIIDTEFKGEPADSSIAKLGRYPMTEEARAEVEKTLRELNE